MDISGTRDSNLGHNCDFLFRKDHKKCEFELHEVYGVDVLISTGDGKAKESETRTTVYKKTDTIYSLKMKASRSELQFIHSINKGGSSVDDVARSD